MNEADLPPPPPHQIADKVFSVSRLAILIVFASILVIFFLSGMRDYLTFETIKENRDSLERLVSANYLISVTGFMILYILAVSFSIPGAVWLTISAGFVFGVVPATIYSVFAATIGATVIFLLTRYLFAGAVSAFAGEAINRMREGFVRNALSYMLVLRLIPLFPFFIVNVVPAGLGVPVRIYMLGTFLGIIPGTFVYALAGDGVGQIISEGGMVDPGSALLEPRVLGPLIGLAVLTMIPVVYKRYRNKSEFGDSAA